VKRKTTAQRDDYWTLTDLKQRLKSSVFSLRLKNGSDGADVTGKARSPIVLCLERRTIRVAVDADRSRRHRASRVDVRRTVNFVREI